MIAFVKNSGDSITRNAARTWKKDPTKGNKRIESIEKRIEQPTSLLFRGKDDADDTQALLFTAR